MVEKQRKGLKALRLLCIGEILSLSGLIIELSFLTPWLNLFAIVSLIGVILMLVGVIRLHKLNGYFFISFIAVLATFLIGVIFGTISGVIATKDQGASLDTINTIESVLSKVISFVYTFGVVRGCALAATGRIKSKFCKHMLIVNGTGKTIAIIIKIVCLLFLENNQKASNILTFIGTIITLAVEIYFCVFLVRTYRKAKALVEQN